MGASGSRVRERGSGMKAPCSRTRATSPTHEIRMLGWVPWVKIVEPEELDLAVG